MKSEKKGNPKTNINEISTTSTLGFRCSPHKETCDILSKDLVYSIIQSYKKKLVFY